MDWYKKNVNGGKEYTDAAQDPGIKSVQAIYNYYKKYDYKTIVMGASFRNANEIIELAGVDFLTISPALLSELQKSEDPITAKLTVDKAKKMDMPRESYTESQFRWHLNEDACATEKLSEGIRKFAADVVSVETEFRQKLKDFQE